MKGLGCLIVVWRRLSRKELKAFIETLQFSLAYQFVHIGQQASRDVAAREMLGRYILGHLEAIASAISIDGLPHLALLCS